MYDDLGSAEVGTSSCLRGYVSPSSVASRDFHSIHIDRLRKAANGDRLQLLRLHQVAHQQEGDTAQLASERSGLDVGTIQQIITQIGGEGSLTQFASAIAADPGKAASFFDKDGDGSVIDDLTGMAKGLFGKS